MPEDLTRQSHLEPRVVDALAGFVCLVCGASLKQPKTGRRRLTCSDRCRARRARGEVVGPTSRASVTPRHESQGLLGMSLKPTIAMRRGDQLVFQCAQCGLVAVQTNLAPGPLGPCPACISSTWWRQEIPAAGSADCLAGLRRG